jgi:hypothetical protein
LDVAAVLMTPLLAMIAADDGYKYESLGLTVWSGHGIRFESVHTPDNRLFLYVAP